METLTSLQVAAIFHPVSLNIWQLYPFDAAK